MEVICSPLRNLESHVLDLQHYRDSIDRRSITFTRGLSATD